jgi:AP2-like factor, ANT lineage
MEDFLGGVGGTGGGAPPSAHGEDQLGCDGDLGSIAAGFLRQYPASGMPEKPGAVTIAMGTDVAESDQTSRPAETFGQRTSIYRGVTRYKSIRAWVGRVLFSPCVIVSCIVSYSHLISSVVYQ